MNLSDTINELAARQIVDDKKAYAIADLILLCVSRRGKVQFNACDVARYIEGEICIECELYIDNRLYAVRQYLNSSMSVYPQQLLQAECERILKGLKREIQTNEKAK